jgi:hypothetical protein
MKRSIIAIAVLIGIINFAGICTASILFQFYGFKSDENKKDIIQHAIKMDMHLAYFNQDSEREVFFFEGGKFLSNSKLPNETQFQFYNNKLMTFSFTFNFASYAVADSFFKTIKKEFEEKFGKLNKLEGNSNQNSNSRAEQGNYGDTAINITQSYRNNNSSGVTISGELENIYNEYMNRKK